VALAVRLHRLPIRLSAAAVTALLVPFRTWIAFAFGTEVNPSLGRIHAMDGSTRQKNTRLLHGYLEHAGLILRRCAGQ
jgi:hypothetical protein